MYGLNLNDEVAKYVKPYFAERSYEDFTDGNVSYNDTIVGTYSKRKWLWKQPMTVFLCDQYKIWRKEISLFP